MDPTTTLPLLSDVVIGSDDIIDTSPASQKLETSKQRTYTDGHITYAHSLLKFDTSVLAGRAVGNARLEMYVEQDVACRWYGPGGVEVKRITSGWKADTVRWSNQPSVTSFGSSIQLCPNTSQIDPNGNWIPRTNTWDVTAMANAWAAGAQSEGIQVSAYSDIDHLPGQGNGFWIYYHSAERVGGTPPKLTVSYWLPPEIPTVTAESIDSLSGNDAIARSQNVKVGFKSAVPEATNLDYTVTVNDSTMQPPRPSPPGTWLIGSLMKQRAPRQRPTPAATATPPPMVAPDTERPPANWAAPSSSTTCRAAPAACRTPTPAPASPC